jgi:HSP20 family protein
LAKEDVKVTLDNGLLTIEGEWKQTKKEDEKFHFVERCYGKFNRTFVLPDNIVADTVRCECKDGVLTLHLPKAEQRKPRAIEVH